MGTILQMQKRFEQVDLTALTADAMEANNESVVELNKDQLFEGIDSKGNRIQPEYSPFTRRAKRERGESGINVTLHDTGAFWSKFYLRLAGDAYSLFSTDSKTGKLVDKYGENIFGLTDESKRKLWVELQPLVVQAIRNITGAR